MDLKTIIVTAKKPSSERFCIAECHRNVRKLSVVRECSRHSEQNLQFLFIICITSNVALSPHPWRKGEFLFQMLQSLAGLSSAQCNHRILGADHPVFQTPQPWLKPWISLSHTFFHVVLRRKLAIWQWLLLNVLRAPHMAAGTTDLREALKCQDYAEISFEVN